MTESNVSFNDYQQFVFDASFYPNKGQNFVYPALGIGGESGEILEKIKKIIRDNNGLMSEESRQAIKKELGDVLFYVAAMGVELGIKMSEIVDANLDKITGRIERGTQRGSGDNR